MLEMPEDEIKNNYISLDSGFLISEMFSCCYFRKLKLYFDALFFLI